MSVVHIDQKEPRQSIAGKSEQLASAYSKELTLRTALQVINCPVTKMVPKSETSHKHQESYFICWSEIIYRLQCSNVVNNL